MRVLDPGHVYALAWLDGEPDADANVLRFVKREGPGYPGNVGHHAGTNLQEVFRALIDRVCYLDRQIHDDRNLEVIEHCRAAIFALESRAAERHGRSLAGHVYTHDIENYETCERCGHIGCRGTCHGSREEGDNRLTQQPDDKRGSNQRG